MKNSKNNKIKKAIPNNFQSVTVWMEKGVTAPLFAITSFEDSWNHDNPTLSHLVAFNENTGIGYYQNSNHIAETEFASVCNGSRTLSQNVDTQIIGFYTSEKEAMEAFLVLEKKYWDGRKADGTA